MSGQIVLVGNKIKAKYKEQVIGLYKHNPYIEALPLVLDVMDVAKRISRRPLHNEEERKLPPLQRIHSVQTISNFIEPLPMHIDLEARFSRMIRNGYMARNPIKAEWIRQMKAGFHDLDWGNEGDDYEPMIRSSATGFAIIGASGVGKTTAVESILGLYPQVIEHTCYNGQPFDRMQLVWLKMDCPQDGSIKGLCLNFFQSVDRILNTKYYERFKKARVTVDVLLSEIGCLSFNLGLGVLVIDEIQRLLDANKGGATKMINAFVQLVNTIGVPVVTVGTFKALKLLGQEFAIARRSSGQGDMIWSNFIKNEDWDDFIESLWEFQWTEVETPLTPALNKALYNESQGIIDIAIKIYMLAQWSVIGLENEIITADLIRQIAKENFKIARPILNALKSGDIDKLGTIPDVQPSIEILMEYQSHATERVSIIGSQDTLGNQQAFSKGIIPEDEKTPFVHIAQWLVDAGVDKDTAMECANKAVQFHSTESDIKVAMQYAYSLAFDLKIPEEQNNNVKKEKQSGDVRTKPLISEDEIDEILDKDKEMGRNILEI